MIERLFFFFTLHHHGRHYDAGEAVRRHAPHRPRRLAPQGLRGLARSAQVAVPPPRAARCLAADRRRQVLDGRADRAARPAKGQDAPRGGTKRPALLPRAPERGRPLCDRVRRPALPHARPHHRPPGLRCRAPAAQEGRAQAVSPQQAAPRGRLGSAHRGAPDSVRHGHELCLPAHARHGAGRGANDRDPRQDSRVWRRRRDSDVGQGVAQHSGRVRLGGREPDAARVMVR